MEKAGLHRRRPYDLRHTFASLLLTAGADRLRQPTNGTSKHPINREAVRASSAWSEPALDEQTSWREEGFQNGPEACARGTQWHPTVKNEKGRQFRRPSC